jgi:O-antigen/teichoic acid export membrane protein
MSTVNKNIVANYVGKLWSFASIFIFIRFYIEILGIQSYAVINFYAVILGLLAFADSGLTVTLNRELAKENTVENKANLLFTFQRIYLGICLSSMLIIFLFSDSIGHNFLKSKLYSPDEISNLVKLIGVGVGLQLFSTLYEGGLIGLQKQVLVNKVNIIWSLCRSGIVILPLLLFPSLKVYFIWQIICNLVLLITFRVFLWRELQTDSKIIFSKQLLSNIWRFAVGMMGIAFISAINIQIDKLVTSKILDLKSFGYYSLAATISQIPLLVATPIIIAIFPVFSKFVSTNNIKEKIIYFHKFAFVITMISAPIVASIFLYSIPLVTFWTGDLIIANAVNDTVKILVIGGFFLCLQLIPYYVSLANGHTRTNIMLGFFGLFVIIPLIIFSVGKYGMIGASFPWILMNLVSLAIMSTILIHKFLPNQFSKWLLHDVLMPSATTIVTAAFVYFATYSLVGKYWFIIEMGLMVILSLFLNILIYNKMNSQDKLIDFKALKSQISK